MTREPITRAEFVKDAVRAALLAALAGVCAVSLKGQSQEAACNNADGCRACREYDQCPVRRTRDGPVP